MKSSFYSLLTLIVFLFCLHAAIGGTAPVNVPELPPTHEGVLNPVTMIALASMIISLVSCFYMMFGQRKTASTEYVRQLEKRVSDDEARIKTLEIEVVRLTRENIELLRRLAQIPPA